MRNASKRSLVLVSLLGVVFIAALFANLFLPYRLAGGATRFASGYSALAFQTLHPGQSMDEVAALVGPSLRETRLPATVFDVYQEPDWYGSPKKTGIASPPDRRFSTRFTDVHYDPAGRVTGVLGTFLHPQPAVGRTRDDIEAVHGAAIYTLSRPALIVHDYSEPAAPEGARPPVWKLRRVVYGEDRRVIVVQAYTHFGPTRLLFSTAPFIHKR
jgi:hypothetical protein